MEFALLPLVQLVFFLKLLRGLDLRRRRFGCYVEEIDVGLQVTGLHELDALRLSCNLLLQFKIIVFFLEVSAAARHILLVLSKSVVQTLLAILLDGVALSLVDELVPLLLLGLLLHLPYF